MPANLVHCRSCRAMLNADLESDSIEIPEFVPMKEIDSYVELRPRGYYVSCPSCDRELKVNAKYLGRRVTCISCAGAFDLDFNNPRIEKLGYYADCPHCSKRLKLAAKYHGMKVACKFCTGHIRLVE
jgi:hypothetical protein